MGRTYRKNGQWVDQTLHRVANKEREGGIERMTKQKMARRHNKKGGNHLEQGSNRQKEMKTLMEGYILQWMDKA